MTDTVTLVRGLSKAFGDKQVLCDVDLSLAPGEVVGFVGPNGAGKTTCLRCLVGLVFRDHGAVDVFGMDPARDPVAIRRLCSYLPGETSIYRGMTGAEFLSFALHLYPAQQHDVRSTMMEHFDLPLNRKVRHYSAGMKQKLALLATLVPDVPMYILDEPDRALDATSRFFLRDVLLHLREKGKTILLSSHHLTEVEFVAHRLIFLVQGRVVAQDRVAAARDVLRRQVRLRLREGAQLPGGARAMGSEPDGTIIVRTEEDPLDWLQALPADQVISAEVGITRLEDLYRQLTGVGDDPVEIVDRGDR